MVWSELERLVEDAESDAMLRRSLRRCRSRRELVMACRRLGYRIQSTDIRMAWSLDRTEPQARDLAASR
ncbi:MAG: nitrogen fixation protein [Cyanobacteriota bacterium]|nr:nitrogen fixation protein [Cyanobacteriota bacterium]